MLLCLGTTMNEQRCNVLGMKSSCVHEAQRCLFVFEALAQGLQQRCEWSAAKSSGPCRQSVEGQSQRARRHVPALGGPIEGVSGSMLGLDLRVFLNKRLHSRDYS